jgi:membrane protease YdiL (CAAX protease family)
MYEMESDSEEPDRVRREMWDHFPEVQPIEPRRVVLLGVLLEGGLVAVALVLGWLCNYRPLATFPVSFDGVLEGLWLGLVATVPMLIGLWLINRYPIGPFDDLKRIVDRMVLPLFRGVGVLGFAAISILAGLGEELLFRGFLQGALAEVLRERINPLAANVSAVMAASVLFGLMHPITRFYAVLCFGVGIYLGCLWILTGNLLAPIVAHALYDFVALVFLTRGSSQVGSSLRESASL